MKHIRKLSLYLLLLLTAMMMFSGAASATAANRSLTAGSGSGAVDALVSIPITLAGPAPADVGGVAFTLAYDATLFEYQGIEAVSPQVISNDPAYTGPIQSTLFYQANDEKVGTTTTSLGRLRIAVGSAVPITQANLFNVKFKIKGGNGLYPINLAQTIITNAPAGYTTPTALPVLVGTGAFNTVTQKYETTVFPEYAADLVPGAITVNVATYGIGGKVTLGDTGTAAIGATAVLKRSPTVDGAFVYDSQTIVNGMGNYSFTGKVEGSYYKVSVTSNYPDYANNETLAFQLSAAVTGQDIKLPAQPRVSLTGSVRINTNIVPGVQVQVWNGLTLLGTYPVDANGNFTTAPFPQGGSYTLKAVYGSLSRDITAGANLLTMALRTIGGTIGNLPGGTTISVTASSVAGKMLKTVTANAGGGYSIENLVPATDYVVSAAAVGVPVTYYNGVTDISTATPVVLTDSADATASFNFPSTSGTVSGTVVEKVGQATVETPVANMVVYASDTASGNLTFALTNDAGAYTLTLAPATYEIFVMKDNGKIFYYNDVKTTQTQAEATLQTIVDQNSQVAGKKIDLTECLNVLSGTVTFKRTDGDPAANVLITATSPLGGGLTITGPGGAYSISGLCGASDTNYIVEMNPLSSQYAVQSATVNFTSAAATQNFIIGEGNTLSGAVKDGSGTGIVGATIYLTDPLTGMMVNGRMYTSGTGGAFTIADIADGVYALNVTHPQYQPSVEQSLQIDRDISDKLVTLTKGAYFKGMVTNASDSKPLPGVLVIITAAGVTPVYAITDATGSYEVFGLNSGTTYTILAQKTGFNRQAKTGSPAMSGTGVDFSLAKPATTFSWSGTILAAGSPVPNAYVLVSSASNNNFYASTATDSTGAYSFKNLPKKDAPGDYTFVVVPGGALRTNVRTGLTLTANKTADNVTIPAGQAIKGKVTGASGTVNVYLFTTAKAFVAATTADTSGNYSFKGLENGDYLVLVIAPAKAPKWNDNKSTMVTADTIAVTGADVTLADAIF